MKRVLLTGFIIILATASCKKSSDSPSAPPSPVYVDTLTAHPWNIYSASIVTDLGTFNYASQETATIEWSTFTFRSDYTYSDYIVGSGTFQFYESGKRIVLMPPTGITVDNTLNALVLTKDTLILAEPTVQLHPMTDNSANAKFEAAEILNDLAVDFSVDTSKIHSIEPEFAYKK